MEGSIAEPRGALASISDLERGEFDEEPDPRASLVGLALSGGGIRSATFALGVLQALGERDVLWMFDYLSTVSGGGYVGGWLSAWLSRPDRVATDGRFPADERLEPDRFPGILLGQQNKPESVPLKNLPTETPEGSRSAWLGDPIHHLRLFSNYLTPRKGALSADTWRAITMISRNLVLTWLILLPLLVTAVIGAQLYYVGNDGVSALFVCSRPDSASVDTTFRIDADAGAPPAVQRVLHPRTERSDACDRALAPVAVPHADALRQRMRVLADPLFAVLLIAAALTVLWMLYGNGDFLPTVIGFAGVGLSAFVLLRHASASPNPEGLWAHFRTSLWFPLSAWAAAAIVLGGGLWTPLEIALQNSRAEHALGRPLTAAETARVPRDRVRNFVVSWHARLLVAATVGLSILLVAGFGHELVWYLFDPQSGAVASAARRAGGWAALLVSGGSALFTVLRAGPTAEGKDAAAGTPSLATKIVIAAAPLLLLLTLLVAAAAVSRALFALVPGALSGGELLGSGISRLAAGALVGCALLCFFAIYERWIAGHRNLNDESGWRRLVVVGTPVLAAALFLVDVGRGARIVGTWPGISVYIAFAVIVLAAVVRLRTRWLHDGGAPLTTRTFADGPVRQRDDRLVAKAANTGEIRALTRAQRTHRVVPLIALILVTVVAESAAWWWLQRVGLVAAPAAMARLDPRAIPALANTGLVFVLLFVVLDLVLTRRESDRSVALALGAAFACGALSTLYGVASASTEARFAVAGIALMSLLVALVNGLGWMADPNLLSLHNFYKARLVRAFLGASNALERKNIEITETAPNDDLPLTELRNHERGAPVHIINTTLNLVGGRDLATAQRFASPFTMSSEICGSARTGYHRTEDYMSGSLTLGTAIAASGAAVSTNMGSKTMSSSLVLLLALFNVRLGLWAPTPSRGRWFEKQPRLWWFYLLSEAFSQTNDLGTYCYLTDGGHFDTTGVYALVERGCRHIVVLDDGADPQPCFSDMGEAIRRCRIDFGAEIDLASGVSEFSPTPDGLAKVHTVRGTIRYAAAHLKMLGWTDEEIKTGSGGHVVWIKPVLTKEDSIDVRQYKLENDAFPQQTTADQWYDESQFESYRALGYQALAPKLERLLKTHAPKGLADVPDFIGRL